MKIIIPTDEDSGYNAKRGAHFGKANYYTIVTLTGANDHSVEVVKNPGHTSHANGGCTSAVNNILSLHPDALIVGGIGKHPAQGFYKAGLKVYIDQSSPTVKEAIENFKANTLQTLENEGTCKAHG